MNIVRFVKGKKNRYIGYNEDGKVILSRNDVSAGYYKLSNITEKEKVIIADTTRVPYDYFPDSNFEEFLKVLEYNKFKIGFIEDYQYKNGSSVSDERLVFAYDTETHMMVVAESWDNCKSLYRALVYCPGLDCREIRSSLLTGGYTHLSVFDITIQDVHIKNHGILHRLKDLVNSYVERNRNMFTDKLGIWNRSEEPDYSNTGYELVHNKIKRACREDMLELFAQSAPIMKVLNS